jgi:adenylosuccinate synthase
MRAGRVVFEGAQGVLLDEKFGFHPYTTWSTTTFANVDKLVGEVGGGPVVRLGLVRAYTTRHGPGPMPSFDERLGGLVDEPFNSFGEWQRGFRVGHFDAVAHRYAVAACGGVDGLAITHLDSVAGQREFGMCDVWVGEDGEQTRELIYPAANDRDLQERVTAKLINTRGVVREVDSDADGWSSQISEALGGEVLCASMGPTCSDKVGSGVLA